MICKIIPVKQARGIKDCWNYITDENKVISIQKKDGLLHKTTIDTSLISMTAEEYMIGKMDFNTVLAYMENDKKTHRTENVHEKFISGYLCTPETAVEEFLDVKEQNLAKQNKLPEEETGNHAYHIIQSFPEDLDISDEEVHQCGRELCEKLRVHQAVICSHVHPVINEEGEVSGKCKHNHILINSHIHPDMLDPEKPNIFKYNNNKENYAQLQKWNDEIALDHGLPIIRNPESDKQYSWYKSHEENKGTSWTARVARDIKNTMRFCSNWEEFKAQMKQQGYHIRETEKNITYYTPDHTESHKQQIRENRLGYEYTKEALEKYWHSINQGKKEMETAENKESKAPIISALINQYGVNLFADVLCKNKYNAYYLDVPLHNLRREPSKKALYTYFEADKTYKLITSDHNTVAEVTGKDIFDYYELLRKKREQTQEQDNADSQYYYFDETKVNTKTNRPYKISRWDSNGRPRTNIELNCILAMVVIKNEHAPYMRHNNPKSLRFKDQYGNIIYAKTDWKLQNMYDTMVMARNLGLENSADVQKKLNRIGKEVARIRKQFKSLTEQHNQMKTINENIERMETIKAVCEAIYKMPDGAEKNAALKEHATELEQYKTAKRYLHMKNINSEAQISEFKTRFASVTEHLREVENDLKSINEEYRKLKKIDYNISMAQNKYYCYGPEHPSLADLPQEQSTRDEHNQIDITEE